MVKILKGIFFANILVFEPVKIPIAHNCDYLQLGIFRI